MGNKRTTERKEQWFDLTFTHADMVDLMNDEQVQIYDGEVPDDQEFDLLLRRSNGSEVLLKEMRPTDTLIVRFKKVTITQVDAEFNDIDII